MTRVRTPEPDLFSEFWALWRPHRRKTDARGKCIGAYQKAILNGHEPEDIVEGTRYYIATLADKDRPYIQLAATYLNDEAFADALDDKADAERRAAEAAERRAGTQSANVVAMRGHISPMARNTQAKCDATGEPYPTWLEAELSRAAS